MIFGPNFSGHFGVPALFLFAAFLALVAALLLVALPADIPRPETPRRWNFPSPITGRCT
jgi:4-amino-4-deoxy-L-arabinose transferase-like glycosyltransferase